MTDENLANLAEKMDDVNIFFFKVFYKSVNQLETLMISNN